jgi:hypothetical protein
MRAQTAVSRPFSLSKGSPAPEHIQWMGQDSRLHAGSSLVGFDDVARDHLDGMLATYGFQVEMSKTEPGHSMRRYRNGHRYITVEATNQNDTPPTGRVKMGTGSNEWPECDWNHIHLWRLIKTKRPDWHQTDYPLDNLTIGKFMDQVAKDLQDYAMEFMAGELFTFKRLRSEIAKVRPPYELFGSGPYSENTLKFMRVSKLLKEKYSSELAA